MGTTFFLKIGGSVGCNKRKFMPRMERIFTNIFIRVIRGKNN